jgi:hypothetical protein
MTDAKRKRQAPLRATVSDRQPEITSVKKRGPYIQDKDLKAAFKNLVRQGLPVASVRKRLQEDFPGARLPSDRTIERWIADYQKARGNVPWHWTGKDADNWVLDVQTAVVRFTEGQGFISEKEAEVLKTIHSVVPNMPALPAWFFCQEILDTPKGQDLAHIFNSLGFARLTSAKDGIPPDVVEAHVASHVRRWPDRPLVAWAPDLDVATLYANLLGPHLAPEHNSGKEYSATMWSDFERDGQFVWLLIFEGEWSPPPQMPWGQRIDDKLRGRHFPLAEERMKRAFQELEARSRAKDKGAQSRSRKGDTK